MISERNSKKGKLQKIVVKCHEIIGGIQSPRIVNKLADVESSVGKLSLSLIRICCLSLFISSSLS